MGLLQTSAMVSGMGQGLERGLSQLQTGLTQWGLHGEDQKFQERKLQQQMEHAEALQGSSQRFQVEQGAQRDLHTEKMTDKQIAAAADLNFENRSTQESIAKMGRETQDRATESTATTAREKLAEEKQHNRDWKDVYGQIADARKTAAAHAGSGKIARDYLDPDVKVQVDARMEMLKSELDTLKKMRESGLQPTDEDGKRAKDIVREIDKLVGVVAPEPPSKKEWRDAYDVEAPGPKNVTDMGGKGVLSTDAEAPAVAPPQVSARPSSVAPKGLLSAPSHMDSLTEGKRALWTREASQIEQELAKTPYPFNESRRKAKIQELKSLQQQLSDLPR